MKCFSTTYPSKGEVFMSFIFAGSMAEATEIAKQRNIGETITGLYVGRKPSIVSQMPSYYYTKRLLVECAHSIAFYSWIASKSGRIRPAEVPDTILGDNGVLHDILHEIQYPKQFVFREEVKQKLINLESIVPGLNNQIVENIA